VLNNARPDDKRIVFISKAEPKFEKPRGYQGDMAVVVENFQKKKAIINEALNKGSVEEIKGADTDNEGMSGDEDREDGEIEQVAGKR
jgi:hypothetical protein